MHNESIEKIKNKLLAKYPLFGSVIANTDFIEKEMIKSIATDGECVMYSSKYINSLSEDEQTFVFAHEICHIAFGHVARRKNRDPHYWSIATDAVINAFLKKDGLPLVHGAVDMPIAIKYDVDEFYDILVYKPDEIILPISSDESETPEGMSPESNSSVDEQSPVENGAESAGKGEVESETEKENDDASIGGDSDLPDQDDGESLGHDDHTLWGDVNNSDGSDASDSNTDTEKRDEEKKDKTEISESEIFEKNEEEKTILSEELMCSLLSQTASRAGKTTDSENREIKNVGHDSMLINWKKVLKEAINLKVDWSYKNAEIEDGVVTSRLEELPKPEAEILLDTSGSIDDSLLRDFLRECKNILKTSKVKAGCFDTEFYGFTEIKTEKDIETMEFIGNGGTDFDIAVDSFSNRVENKIIFTDGNADMPIKPMNAIWVVFGKKEINPLGGKVIEIDINA